MKSPAVPESTAPARASGPAIMVIFGASGDLTRRKLVPALYNLARHQLLPPEFAVLGVARSELSHEDFRQKATDHLAEFLEEDADEALWKPLASRMYYMPGDLGDAGTYTRLRKQLEELDARHHTRGNYLFYLSVAPQFFGSVIRHLGDSGLCNEHNRSWRRVIIEKPFGTDLESAHALNREIRGILDEKQIYRIDHYLGKETVQNLLVFRFANGIFEPTWNRRYVDHVQITVAEELGVEARGAYYDGSGALRDMVPNHIFQLVSLTAMEPPVSFEANSVRDEQAKALRAIVTMTPEGVLSHAVRGQYGPGIVNDEQVPGYRHEDGVPPDSSTETYVAMQLTLDNWRWGGVPFYLRTGKRLAQRVTQIEVQFKRAPTLLFRQTSVTELEANRLVIRIQPDEGISLSLAAKIPGAVVRLGTVNMEFLYRDYFGSNPSTGYERLIYDCLLGDATLFQRADMVEAGWAVVAPVLDVWRSLPPRVFPNYTAGSWGPREADQLLQREGRRWGPGR